MKLINDKEKLLDANPDLALTASSSEKPLLAKFKADRKQLELQM